MKATRFRPPALNPPPELRWVLHRAFAAPESPTPPPPDPNAAFDLAARLDLASRIAAHTNAASLKAEAGPVAATFTRTLHQTAARGLRYEHTLKTVASLAESRGITLVVLKGSAIRLLGIGSPGARNISDLDILVAADRLEEMAAALVETGWSRAPTPGYELHAPPLSHPSLGTIELHYCILGVRLPGSRQSLDGRRVETAGLTQPLPNFSSAVRAPSVPVLTAHALVHGLVQHGYAPRSYPLFRLLADLQDLVAHGAGLRDALSFLREIDADDMGAIEALMKALGEGTALELPEGPARSVLAHLVAGSLEPDYGIALKSGSGFALGLSDFPLPLLALRQIAHAVFLSRPQVDAVYGQPKRKGGYLARQVFRPADLVRRLGLSIWARLNNRVLSSR